MSDDKYFQDSALSVLKYQLAPIKEYLENEDITEIAFNGAEEAFIEEKGEWKPIQIQKGLVTEDSFLSIGNVLSGSSKVKFGIDNPVFSGSLDLKTHKMRIQITCPPASKKWSLTIRKFSKTDFTLEQLNEAGLFKEVKVDYRIDKEAYVQNKLIGNKEKHLEEEIHKALEAKDFIKFFELCIQGKKNIIISGATGSGKTTFAKALIHKIPLEERLITIEDAEEIRFEKHKNFVQLFFDRNEGSSRTAEQMFLSCMRMKPDRVLLSEIRGGEALIYIESVISDHPGSITTLHASSVEQAQQKLIMMIQRSGTKIPVEFFNELIEQNINVILQINKVKNKRSLTGILYQ